MNAKHRRAAWRPSLLSWCVAVALAIASNAVGYGGDRPPIHFRRTFQHLRFERPVLLTAAPNSSALYVVELDGRIHRLVRDATGELRKSLFLDITDRVGRRHSEEGLLGLAFAPDYATSDHFFVHYSSKPDDRYGTLSRFSRNADGVADPQSELVILRQAQPWRNHNGGCVEFGPDGYLYIGFGDGGAAGDPRRAGQDLSKWLGKILRIDVRDATEDHPYRIPGDNPFRQVDGARPEIWAYGLRNPWRFSFDRESGRLWVGDVGQNSWEEINIVTRGGNYGWNSYEGDDEFRGGAALNGGPHIGPVFRYPPERRGLRRVASVTGGYVYRGQRFPELRGSYLFGDFEKRRMWLLRPRLQRGDASAAKGDVAVDPHYEAVELPKGPSQLSSFGQDNQGELYLVSLTGEIWELTRHADDNARLLPFPKRLSQTGFFTSTTSLAPSASLLPYDVIAPLWSDGADKDRFIVLPDGGKIGFHVSRDWSYPVGTTLIKHFRLATESGRERRLETRVIRRGANGWSAVSYVWNEAQDDATLTPEGATLEFDTGKEHRSWRVPSSEECSVCHTSLSGFLLGADRTEQMLHRSQRERLTARMDSPPERSATLPSHVYPYDTTQALDRRARSYLDSNCAGCHQPGGPGNAAIDLRFDRPLPVSGLFEPPQQGDRGLVDARLVVPGAPERSVLLDRLRRTADSGDTGQMPPIGRTQIDERAIELLERWIRELPQSRQF